MAKDLSRPFFYVYVYLLDYPFFLYEAIMLWPIAGSISANNFDLSDLLLEKFTISDRCFNG